MRYISIVLLALFTISLSSPLLGQEDTLCRVGLGVSFDPTKISELVYISSSPDAVHIIPTANSSAIVFYVPINVTKEFRLEPSIGLFSMSSSSTETSTIPSSGDPSTNSIDASVITIGVRGTFISHLSNSLLFYFGPRLELGIVSSTNEYTYISNYPLTNTTAGDKTTTKETDITFGGVVGTEYFPIHKFSFGGEISLNYVTFGNPDITREYYPPQSPSSYTTKREQHTLYTSALFFLRWYFL
jgi:hypothetical protein